MCDDMIDDRNVLKVTLNDHYHAYAMPRFGGPCSIISDSLAKLFQLPYAIEDFNCADHLGSAQFIGHLHTQVTIGSRKLPVVFGVCKDTVQQQSPLVLGTRDVLRFNMVMSRNGCFLSIKDDDNRLRWECVTKTVSANWWRSYTNQPTVLPKHEPNTLHDYGEVL